MKDDSLHCLGRPWRWAAKVASAMSSPVAQKSAPVVCLGLTVLTTNIMTPIIVGMYVDSFRLSVGQAGYTAAAYLAGGGLGGIAVSFLVLRVRTNILLATGLVLLTLGNFASMFVTPLWGILSIRMIAGAGEGVGFGLTGAAISRLPNPGRIYGIFVVLMLLMGALIFYSIPPMRNVLGARGILIPIAVLPLGMTVIIPKFPALTQRRARFRSGSARGTNKSATGTPLALGLWMVPLATFVIYGAYGSEFAYAERLGVRAGITADVVARLLAGSSLVAIAGAGLATILPGSRAIALKLSGTLAIAALCIWAMVYGKSTAYQAGLVVFTFVWFFFVPTLMTVVSLLDPDGRLAAASLGAMEWGMAAGPAVAAACMSGGSLRVIGSIAAVGFAIGLLMLVPAVRSPHYRQESGGTGG